MAQALRQAAAAARHGEVPVGAVVVRDGRVLARAGNRASRHTTAGHAEVQALRARPARWASYRVTGATLRTVEPCAMCVGVPSGARRTRVVYAVGPQGRRGGIAVRPAERPPAEPPHGGDAQVAAAASRELLRAFFRARRAS
jgi:tRNA(adenine34) deaminase